VEVGSSEVIFLPIGMADSVPAGAVGEALDHRVLVAVALHQERDARAIPDPA
jgi:hypothetical protein